MKWFLIPASRKNIARSLTSSVPPAELRQFLGEEDINRLADLGDGEIRCWAMTQGVRAQFVKMAPGDYVLFSEEKTGKFNYFAEVTAKIANKALGDKLWPVQPRAAAKSKKTSSWELIYFLKNVRAIDANKSALMVLLGHKPNDNIGASRQFRDDYLAEFEAKHGSLLEWLHVNAKLARETRRALPAVTAQPDPLVTIQPSTSVGKEYVPSMMALTYEARERTLTYNADKLERGNLGHVATQEALAAFLIAHGIVPLSPDGEPAFDIAWTVGETMFVAEVKSTTEDNEEDQLRFGLGQVLWYRHRLRGNKKRVVAVLVPEKEPTHPDWITLCEALGVYIAWPGAFDRIL